MRTGLEQVQLFAKLPSYSIGFGSFTRLDCRNLILVEFVSIKLQVHNGIVFSFQMPNLKNRDASYFQWATDGSTRFFLGLFEFLLG
jgi:hypothetical protein